MRFFANLWYSSSSFQAKKPVYWEHLTFIFHISIRAIINKASAVKMAKIFFLIAYDCTWDALLKLNSSLSYELLSCCKFNRIAFLRDLWFEVAQSELLLIMASPLFFWSKLAFVNVRQCVSSGFSFQSFHVFKNSYSNWMVISILPCYFSRRLWCDTLCHNDVSCNETLRSFYIKKSISRLFHIK